MLIGSLRDGWTKYFDIKIPRDPSFMRVTGRWAGQDVGLPVAAHTFHISQTHQGNLDYHPPWN